MPWYKTRLYYKTLYNKTKKWLQGEIENYQDVVEGKEQMSDGTDDIFVGRSECAESLLNQMETWEVKWVLNGA